jgi:predicted metal-dependent phosphoesterase TrpH
MVDIDLHTHSRFFHGFEARPTPYDKLGLQIQVAVARVRNLDAIAVTNHDYAVDFDAEIADLTVLPGIEISSSAGHLLVVGPDPPRQTNPNRMSPDDVVDIAHERDCAVIMAHPFRNSHVKETDADVDAVEVNGKRPQPTKLVEELATKKDLPIVGGSDAHYPVEIGRVYTRIDIDEVTPENVVEAIKDGRTEYRITDRFPDQFIHRLYSITHRLKGHTEKIVNTGSSDTDGNVLSSRPVSRADREIKPED